MSLSAEAWLIARLYELAPESEKKRLRALVLEISARPMCVYNLKDCEVIKSENEKVLL